MSEVEFKQACSQTEIPKGAAKNANLDGVEVTIFNTSEGFIVCSSVCKHKAFKLELCEISGDITRWK